MKIGNFFVERSGLLDLISKKKSKERFEYYFIHTEMQYFFIVMTIVHENTRYSPKHKPTVAFYRVLLAFHHLSSEIYDGTCAYAPSTYGWRNDIILLFSTFMKNSEPY